MRCVQKDTHTSEIMSSDILTRWMGLLLWRGAETSACLCCITCMKLCRSTEFFAFKIQHVAWWSQELFPYKYRQRHPEDVSMLRLAVSTVTSLQKGWGFNSWWGLFCAECVWMWYRGFPPPSKQVQVMSVGDSSRKCMCVCLSVCQLGTCPGCTSPLTVAPAPDDPA